MLARTSSLPTKLTEIEPTEILEVFPRPTLVHIEGSLSRPLFLSVLLHGNETSSFRVLQHLAREYANTPPPRSLLVFIGNVEATAAGVRYLSGQMDFNRIWADGDTEYHALTAEVLRTARTMAPFASIDIHNTSGDNPYYGCVNTTRPPDLFLASLFSDIGVYYRNPSTTQSIAFSDICPAVTVECGKSGDRRGIEKAINLVEHTLRLEHFPDTSRGPRPKRLYESVGSVIVDPETDIGFGRKSAELDLRRDLQELNFHDVGAGTYWGTCRTERSCLQVVDEHGNDRTKKFFAVQRSAISLNIDCTPAMITNDVEVIRQDCLCYLMVPLNM